MGKSYWLKDEDQKGNFTNEKQDTFDPQKRYIGVRLQQGVPLLDRDWNELEDIRRYEEMITRREYIGNGSPDDGFKISAANSVPENPDNINNFKIGTGRCLVDGFEVVNEPSEQKQYIFYTDQKLEALAPPIDAEERMDTVYLDVWIDEVRSQDNNDLLNNPQDLNEETTVRHKLVWRVRVRESTNLEPAPQYHHYYDLARIKRKKGQDKILDSDIEDLREGRGKDKLTTKSLIFKNDQIPTKEWPKLTCEAANQVDLSGNLIIKDSGKFGIGTNNPQYTLDVNAASIKLGLEKNGGGQLVITNNPNDNAIYLEAYSSEGSGSASSFILSGIAGSNVPLLDARADNAVFRGNVGIGTTDIKKPLHVEGISEIHSGGSGAGFSFADRNIKTLVQEPTKGERWVWYSNKEKAYLWSKDDLLTIDKGGKVGIGTTDPKDKLDVFGDAYFGTGTNNENHKVVIRGPNGPSGSDSSQDLSYEFAGAGSAKIRAYRGGSWDTYLQFLTSPATTEGDKPQVRMQINGDGNVGIGTTNPSERLVVTGTVKAQTFDGKFIGDGSEITGLTTNQLRGYLDQQIVNIGEFRFDGKDGKDRPYEPTIKEVDVEFEPKMIFVIGGANYIDEKLILDNGGGFVGYPLFGFWSSAKKTPNSVGFAAHIGKYNGKSYGSEFRSTNNIFWFSYLIYQNPGNGIGESFSGSIEVLGKKVKVGVTYHYGDGQDMGKFDTCVIKLSLICIG